VAVEHDRDLIGDAKYRPTPSARIEHLRDNPLVVRAIAEGDRSAQGVISAEARLGELAVISYRIEFEQRTP